MMTVLERAIQVSCFLDNRCCRMSGAAFLALPRQLAGLLVCLCWPRCSAVVTAVHGVVWNNYYTLPTSGDHVTAVPGLRPFIDHPTCPRKPELIINRKCLKKCRSDIECRGRNRRCLCDDACGKSCVKQSAPL